MRILKNLFLVMVSFFLIASLFILQVNVGIRETLTSQKYLEDNAYNTKLEGKISEFLVAKIDSLTYEDFIEEDKKDLSPQEIANGEKLVQSLKDLIRNNIDMNWIGKEISHLITGAHGFIVNDEEELPILDISPVKEIIPSIASEPMIAVETVKEKLKIDQININLDLNVIMDKIFLENDNPVKEVRNLITWYKESFLYINIVVVVLLLSIILITSGKIKGFFLWTSVSTIISGILGVLLIFVGKDKLLSAVVSEINEEIILFKEFIMEFISGVFNKVFYIGAAFIVFGILIFIISLIFGRKKNNKKESVKKSEKNIFVKIARVTAVIVCSLGIVITITNGVNECISRVEKVQDAFDNTSANFNNVDIIKIISESQNIQFLNEFTKK
ncbi:hypothetical protein [Oceanirhabdus sp. W0125-5]|uniref:hypothetical protein n=1 Tax=Oceanirhabdus sp. W0125-5 TaxID=2999116 RepID=UPI0022F2CCD6|nr:hypothetical protein [Oceanirhabdus sp. W0125-5]WBW95290.1 hypothetical protein OW730_16530 [Oceanirhabdus sp. W0125-5]